MADRFPGDEIDAVLVVSFVDPVDTAAKRNRKKVG
jgi:hypothetical protein